MKQQLKNLLLILLALGTVATAESPSEPTAAHPKAVEDRVLAMTRAVILDPLNARTFRGGLGSYDRPFALKDGHHVYEKYRLSELPQEQPSEVRMFQIDKVKVKFKGAEFIREELRFGYRLKLESTGEIFRWRETSGWKPIEVDPFFGKDPRLKSFKRTREE